jgi:type 1 glutamine amidotransferase
MIPDWARRRAEKRKGESVKIARFIPLLAASLLWLPASLAADTRIAIIVGPSKHPPGTHEVAAGGRLMRWALENMANVPGVKAEIYEEWPRDPAVLAKISAIVFMGDTFPPERMPGREANMAALADLVKRGVGIACVHYATGLTAGDVTADGSHPLLGWLGGYFATGNRHHQSVAKVFTGVTISPAAAPGHPVSRGWSAFTLDEEPYYNNYFGPGGNKPAANVTIFATAMLPPETPKPEPVAWGVQRPDGGRGFAIVMPHFYRNWANEDLRRFVLNGIVWSAKLEVPVGGVRTPAPELGRFAPESVEPKPRAPSAKQP